MKRAEADKLRIAFSKALVALLFDMMQAEAGLLTDEEVQVNGEKVGEELGQVIDSMVDEK